MGKVERKKQRSLKPESPSAKPGNAGGWWWGFLASVPRSQPLEEEKDDDDGQRSTHGRPEHRVGLHGDD